MNSLMKSTYTYALLKDNILKALGEYSLNGAEKSSANGFLADVEKKFVSTLNICLRRVILSLPLLKKNADLQFFSGRAALPEDFGRAEALFVNGTGCISESAYRTDGNMIECSLIGNGGFAVLTYRVNPKPFTPDMPSYASVDLPDITADALCYLTAAELCPAEYGELYGKLMYKYRDICLNLYGCEKNTAGRNSFFRRGTRKPLLTLREGC